MTLSGVFCLRALRHRIPIGAHAVTSPKEKVMKRASLVAALLLAAFSVAPALAATTSVFTTRPDDPKAAYVQDMGAKGDGKSDDTAAIQATIDKVATTRLGGTVFLPSGRYRLTHTIYVWDAVRLIGYGV